MATVTIGRPYFEALLRRAEFHTLANHCDSSPDLLSHVTISKAEHDYLLQATRDYNTLKNALFRGGLTKETLETLLSADGEPTDDYTSPYSSFENTFVKPNAVPITIGDPSPGDLSPGHDKFGAGGPGLSRPRGRHFDRAGSCGQFDSIDDTDRDEEAQTPPYPRIPVHDQRTIVISNLSEGTTHKDLTDVIRGGRLLDIYLRNDRTATVSFVEGAQEFLSYTKRNDIYLHLKRLEFRWSDRQFHVPGHVSNKIANGATRNLVVRGAAGRQISTDDIRDHLDHIHNLVVVDANMKNGDAYISTNSVHNALFARTCMMSRTAYKGLRIDWYPDECAAPLPRATSKVSPAAIVVPTKKMTLSNRYTVLDPESGDSASDEASESFMASGVKVNWTEAQAA